tara:strand:+ start:2342 stop:2524 length:183 start_codon:yes stop_codon:yes gene_type:complete
VAKRPSASSSLPAWIRLNPLKLLLSMYGSGLCAGNTYIGSILGIGFAAASDHPSPRKKSD